jgi:hypothetical protein
VRRSRGKIVGSEQYEAETRRNGARGLEVRIRRSEDSWSNRLREQGEITNNKFQTNNPPGPKLWVQISVFRTDGGFSVQASVLSLLLTET